MEISQLTAEKNEAEGATLLKQSLESNTTLTALSQPREHWRQSVKWQ